MGCNIAIMKRFLPLLILTGLLFGQDVLTHKSGKIYKGKYYGIVEQNKNNPLLPLLLIS